MLKSSIRKVDYHKLYYSHDATRVGMFDMPQLQETQAIPRNVISFNERKSIINPTDKWIDFFIDDYKFAIMEKLLYFSIYKQISIIKSLPSLNEFFKLSETYTLSQRLAKKLKEEAIKNTKQYEFDFGISNNIEVITN